MNYRPITDLDKLVKAEVELQLKEYDKANKKDHIVLLGKLNTIEALIKKTNKLNEHDIIQYLGIAVLFVLLLTCF